MNPLNVNAATGPASSLDQIAELLKKNAQGPSDISALPVVVHAATGARFRVGPMKRASHEAYHALRFLEEKRYQESGAAEKGAPFVRSQSDEYLLTHALWSEDGQKLPKELVELLMNGEGFGPSTYSILEAAAAQNPPRPMLVSEIAQIWGASGTNLVFWRVVREAGLFQMIIDRLAGNEEEQARASHEFQKLEVTLDAFEALFEVEDLAKETGFKVYDHKREREEQEEGAQ